VSGLAKYDSDVSSTIIANTLHQHKNSGGSTSPFINLVPPSHNAVLMQTTTNEGLSNFIKKSKKGKRKNKAFAILGMRIAPTTNSNEDNNDQSELEDNIDKGMLLKPGQEFDSSENGEGSDLDQLYNDPSTTPVHMAPKQVHSQNFNIDEQMIIALNKDTL